MKRYSKPYTPAPWNRLGENVRRRCRTVAVALHQALQQPAATHAELAQFRFDPPSRVAVRPDIAQEIAKRPAHDYSMVHEKTCLDRFAASGGLPQGGSIYDAACAIRSVLFQAPQPLRTFNVTISHTPSLAMRPPLPADAVFGPLPVHQGARALFDALTAYLVLLSAHPFSDGNGRTARILFNGMLAHVAGSQRHYVPMANLTRATGGVYEELFIQAGETGHYQALMLHLLDLLDAYVRFIGTRGQAVREGDLARAARLAQAHGHAGAPAPDINHSPPYPVSLHSVVTDAPPEVLDRRFIEAAIDVGQTLAQYGEIAFAITRLSYLTARPYDGRKSLAFFLKTLRKEDLIVHARVLRTRYIDITHIQIAVSTANAVADAKVLIQVAAQYTDDIAGSDCAVMLHDFATPDK